MSAERWAAVDAYLQPVIDGDDPALLAALEASRAAGLPDIQVSPAQGKLLLLLARMVGARRILEIGALGGYSTIWLARALPAEGRIISLEVDPAHAEVARANLARAEMTDRASVRLGPALLLLPELEREGAGPFDLCFIDADKRSNAEYLDWAIRLSRPGSVIVVDNVVRDGGVLDGATDDVSIRGTRRFLQQLAADRRVDATVLQTVGSKGYDGFALAMVR